MTKEEHFWIVKCVQRRTVGLGLVLLNSSIYCKSITDTSHSQITESIKTSQGEFSASTFMSNHFTSREVVVSNSTTEYYDSDQSPSTNYTQQMSSNFVPSNKQKN